ncbi:MAG: hypothetical protein L3J93_05380 [Thermoplasmata archaeon]|nr:hypothetical protein [Thermoplasmata archaeon]
MNSLDRLDALLATATLARSRALLRSRGGRALSIFIGAAYALASMLTGQMLLLVSNPAPHYSVIIWSGNGAQPWNYPALLVSAGWGVLALPFFPTVAMLVVSIGVGLGMAVSVLLVVQLVRERRRGQGRAATFASLSGLSPALLALLTLGACCSTTAAATAGLGVLAQASGTTVAQLLAGNWFLGVFQIFVLWIALLAQEQLISVYSVLGGRSPDRSTTELRRARAPVVPPAGGLLRAVLLLGGVVGALSVPAAWLLTPPETAGAATWFDWTVGRGLLAALAIVAALFPEGTAHALAGIPRHRAVRTTLRGVLFVVGIAVAGYVPPPIAGLGFFGLGNQLLGVLGLPGSWGAVRPYLPNGPSLWFSWAFQFLVLGVFAIALALWPGRTLDRLAPTGSRGAGGDATHWWFPRRSEGGHAWVPEAPEPAPSVGRVGL